MPSHQERVKQSYCEHNWYLNYNKVEDWYSKICTRCGKKIKLCRSVNGNTPENLFALIEDAKLY